MKKKLLVLLIAVAPTLMPNMASAVAIDVGGIIPPNNPISACDDVSPSDESMGFMSCW